MPMTEKRKKEIKKNLTKRETREEPIVLKGALSWGSTLLNLACTGHPRRGIPRGKVAVVPGQSTSGKTFIAYTLLAEAARNKRFRKYRLIYDNAEDGALMDKEAFFGTKAAERIEAPFKRDGMPAYSENVEDFYYGLDDAIKSGIPFIWVLDSMDAVGSKQEDEVFEKQKKADRANKKAPGSFDMRKQKLNSQGLRRLQRGLTKTNSIVVIVAQTRDNVDPFSFTAETYGGGRSLKYYAVYEVWAKVIKPIKKDVKGIKEHIGTVVQFGLGKNRVTGRLNKVKFPIYFDYGIDDITGCIEYLVEYKHWKKAGGKVNAVELGVKLGMSQLIKHIENNNLERKLQKVVAKVWNEREQALKTDRKKRYD